MKNIYYLQRYSNDSILTNDTSIEDTTNHLKSEHFQSFEYLSLLLLQITKDFLKAISNNLKKQTKLQSNVFSIETLITMILREGYLTTTLS